MDFSLLDNLSTQADHSLKKGSWRTHSQPKFVVVKPSAVSVDDPVQKARQEEEKLRQWRMRVQQIRGK